MNGSSCRMFKNLADTREVGNATIKCCGGCNNPIGPTNFHSCREYNKKVFSPAICFVPNSADDERPNSIGVCVDCGKNPSKKKRRIGELSHRKQTRFSSLTKHMTQIHAKFLL